MINNEILLRLSQFKKSLKSLMDPKILEKLVSLLEAFGDKSTTSVEQFEFWIQKNGDDCRYATIAKEIFLNDNASNVAKEIIYLYENWAKYYK